MSMNDMNIDVLISCMFQKDLSIVDESRLAGSAVIVNQCDTDSYDETTCDGGLVKVISTAERGLSRSRNMAIGYSDADVCLVSDDDEVYADGYADKIREAYHEYPDSDVVIFKIGNAGDKRFPDDSRVLGYLGVLRVSSQQISFRRHRVKEAGIRFDEMMGSGTGHGSGEEVKFLFDCLKAGLKIRYVPVQIATLKEKSDSQWFHGFTDEYFVRRGWSTAHYMGKFFSFLYCTYFAVTKYSLYSKDNNFLSAYFCMLKGIVTNVEDL